MGLARHIIDEGGLGLVGRALLFCSFLKLLIMTGFLFLRRKQWLFVEYCIEQHFLFELLYWMLCLQLVPKFLG